ncbi:PIG-L family deacetylase [Acidocella aromatica]|uniref:LmbE family N-acetylglucosaminyl deacetylase n=1 Tax=Acidocella aromatica TaxID=1303579 RepID=A0A840VQ31_9PROT|nr:PIG-L family deacetylase [Acidocella aromatica]MBB5374219.1 LmbE family N-acetylglucosaminyl deacetylase [Acidocella aromatica]
MTTGKSAVVVAHPDDEILWLSSALPAADKIVFCFGDLYGNPKRSAARRRAVAALALPNLTDLQIPESGVRKLVDWERAEPTPYGVEIAEPEGRARYEANFAKLVSALRPVLAGYGNVFTHNPWGEYGHPEHVQVYRAVCALQAELGFTVWFSNYVAPLSLPLARQLAAQPCWTSRELRRPNVLLARRWAWTYLRHGAWTWILSYRWPRRETLYAQPPAGALHPLHGETLLDISRLRLWRWGKAARVLD